ncbi:hypothetical protein B0A55_01545 [Friedmanniomyces simplex]|uniref:Thioredoxin domain-containing protein n=1 Tax=Friedmanniomyces simplex TaxID=329884 RepID=A0A4U0Y2I7_9PEZI|nr:hypothetical protein B0A55_01545 [Friedmanniomyces simplex]
METLTDRNSYVKATNKDGFCVLEATAAKTWCSQCKAMAPFVDKMIKKYPEARFYKYDTDTADDITQELGANQMPTFHAFKDGDLMGSVTGAKAAQLEDLIKESYEGQVVDTED